MTKNNRRLDYKDGCPLKGNRLSKKRIRKGEKQTDVITRPGIITE